METMVFDWFIKSILDWLAVTGAVGTDGPLKPSGLSALLITDTATHSPEDALTSFTEATFGGYARKTPVAFATAYWDQSGRYVQTVTMNWVMTDGTTPQTITGMLIIATGPTPDAPAILYTFDPPVQLGTAGQGFTKTFVMTMPAQNSWGFSSAID